MVFLTVIKVEDVKKLLELATRRKFPLTLLLGYISVL